MHMSELMILVGFGVSLDDLIVGELMMLDGFRVSLQDLIVVMYNDLDEYM